MSARVAEVETLPAQAEQRALVPITPMEMLDRAVQGGASIEILGKLMDLQERWEKNQARKAFEASVAAAKAEIPVIRKNKHVGFESKRTDTRTDYWHEDMGEIARTIDPILGRHKLNYRFRAKQDGAKLKVTCILAHADGYFEETELEAGNDTTGNKNAHQGVGSAATYLQRYTLKLALGLAASKDDDAQAADAGDTVTDEQVQEISALLAETKSNLALFLKTIKLDSLTQIRADKFDDAVKLIRDTAAKRAAREAQQKQGASS